MGKKRMICDLVCDRACYKTWRRSVVWKSVVWRSVVGWSVVERSVVERLAGRFLVSIDIGEYLL
jgi:hypothetical protein